MNLPLASLVLATAPGLVACTGGERAQSGQCPAGEICSPATPRGLHFIGNNMSDQLLDTLFGPAATAIGGTQEIALEYDRGDDVHVAMNLPYEADDDGGRGIQVLGKTGSVVTIGGVASRSNYLRIVDPATEELYDRKELTGAALERIALVGTDFETLPPGDPTIVWATGDQHIGIALWGEVQHGNAPRLERIVDSSLEATLAGAQRTAWDEVLLPGATVGVHTLTITAGDKPAAPFPVEIVDGATTMMLLGDPSPTVMTGSSTSVCFAAMHGERYVYGLTWTFVVDGETIVKDGDDLNRNCVSVTTDKPAGTIAVSASAGGQSAATTVTIGVATRRAGEIASPVPGALVRSESTAGDRAAAAHP